MKHLEHGKRSLLTWAIFRRCPLDQTMNAFIGRFTWSALQSGILDAWSPVNGDLGDSGLAAPDGPPEEHAASSSSTISTVSLGESLGAELSRAAALIGRPIPAYNKEMSLIPGWISLKLKPRKTDSNALCTNEEFSNRYSFGTNWYAFYRNQLISFLQSSNHSKSHIVLHKQRHYSWRNRLFLEKEKRRKRMNE